jgi:hypothetical protein
MNQTEQLTMKWEWFQSINLFQFERISLRINSIIMIRLIR